MFTYIIADDEPLIRKGTIAKIAKQTNAVTCIGEASNGMEALSLVEEKNPDIIITDMNMPIMDGSALLDQLTLKYPSKSIIVISGYKDFSYAKKALDSNAINYLLKPFGKAEILDAINIAIERMSEKSHTEKILVKSEEEKESVRFEYDCQLLKNLILGYDESSDDFTSERITHLNTSYTYTLFTFYCLPQTQPSAFKNRIDSFVIEGNILSLSSHVSSNLFFLLYFSPESLAQSKMSKQLDLLKTSFQLANEESSFFHFAGISRPHHELKHLNKAYHETLTALNSRYVSSTDLFSEAPLSSPTSMELSWEGQDALLFRIETGDMVSVEAMTDELFVYFESHDDCSIQDIKLFCYQLSNKVRLIMMDYFDNVQTSTSSTTAQNIINTLFTLEELNTYFKQFLINISEILKSKSLYNLDDTIDKVKLYIEKNYNKNITVEFVSSLFYLNRSYLSHMFRQKSGMKFVDYVNKIRVEQAKVQLASTQKMMYQIGKSVGYDNVKYFYRVFKKVEGVTPKQYQDSCKHSQ